MKKVLSLITLCMFLLASTAFASSSSVHIDLNIQCKKPLQDKALMVYADGLLLVNFEEKVPSIGYDHVYSATI